MLRLDLTAGPRWIDILPGVRFEVLPMTTTMMIEAQRSLPKGVDAVEVLDEPAVMTTEQQVAFAKAIAQRAVIAWEGVVGIDGKPIKITPEGVAAAIDKVAVFSAFQVRYVTPGMTEADEGNVSAPSPTGTSAAARRIARPAKASAKTAPAAKTRR